MTILYSAISSLYEARPWCDRLALSNTIGVSRISRKEMVSYDSFAGCNKNTLVGLVSAGMVTVAYTHCVIALHVIVSMQVLRAGRFA